MCLATLFLQPVSRRPDTIILDEPELGLHPAALNVLADIIRATAKETQVICSTQSVAFANLFEPEDFIVVDAEDGVSNFRRLEREPLEHWLEDYGMGDIWSKNLIGGRPAW
ncbi:MAG: AAA family ATPase [Candidatus Scalindua rubra]|nr:AAA family ATPase [Candidatus Scalindua rubra]